jgi:hypothetical protein
VLPPKKLNSVYVEDLLSIKLFVYVCAGLMKVKLYIYYAAIKIYKIINGDNQLQKICGAALRDFFVNMYSFHFFTRVIIILNRICNHFICLEIRTPNGSPLKITKINRNSLIKKWAFFPS